jgi:hypothetical protein
VSESEGRRGAALASLALGPGADEDDIRIAYRRLVMRYHPDATGDPLTAKRFTRVVRAYKVLVATATATEGAVAGPGRERSRYRSVDEARASGGTDLFALGQVLASDPEPGARGAAARALGLSGRSAAYVFLRRALYDPAPEVALEAVRAVALLGSRQAEGEVAALYSRADAAIKARILELALATGERLFRSTLAAAEGDADPALRALASRAAAQRAP